MRQLVLASVFVLASGGAAQACEEVFPAKQAKIDAQQRAEFQSLVLQTAARADAIYIAKVLRVTTNPNRATFHIDKVIKGRAVDADLVTFDLPNIDSVVIACGGPEEFGSVFAVPHESFIIYVVAGRLVRSAPVERGRTNLTLSEELRLAGVAHGT